MSDDQEKPEEGTPLSVKKHIQYFKRILNILPHSVTSMDTSRMTILFFGLSGLDLLSALDSISDEDKKNMIDWIYGQQILPTDDNPADMGKCGFRGGTFLGMPLTNDKPTDPHHYDNSHVTMVYTALACLLILGDDLSRVNKMAVLSGVRRLQLDDGSFTATLEGAENDMRFVFCASCVCYMLNDWSGMDIHKTVDYIKRSQSYDYGIGQGPYLESHGGSTFCAVASLVLMDKLSEAFSSSELEGLKRWCLRRQQTGFQGRPNKPVDTCYSFWIGATLNMLGCSSLVDQRWNRSYILSTQGNITGGFSKWPESHPDPLHSYLGLCGLSLNGEPDLSLVNAPLNITQRAADWLKHIHSMQK